MASSLETRVTLVEERVERHRKELDEMKSGIKDVTCDLRKLVLLFNKVVWMFAGAALLFLLQEIGILAVLKGLIL